MKRTVFEMSEDERREFATMIGETVLMMEEGKGTWQIAEKFGMTPKDMEWNITEILYWIRKHIGVWRFIKTIFIK